MNIRASCLQIRRTNHVSFHWNERERERKNILGLALLALLILEPFGASIVQAQTINDTFYLSISLWLGLGLQFSSHESPPHNSIKRVQAWTNKKFNCSWISLAQKPSRAEPGLEQAWLWEITVEWYDIPRHAMLRRAMPCHAVWNFPIKIYINHNY